MISDTPDIVSSVVTFPAFKHPAVVRSTSLVGGIGGGNALDQPVASRGRISRIQAAL
jgi:hypothetical protein